MSNYSGVIYTGDKNTTWFKIFNNISEKSRVLDVGCSSGNFGGVLIKNKGCEVVGVDLDKDDVKRAKKLLNEAFVINVERDDLRKLGKFDRIIFADVLEHLNDPVAILMKVKKLLRPGGQVLFSIPNMAHMGTRLMLLGGEFRSGETGLLDKTHLHFYDEVEVRRIFREAGYSISAIDWTEYYIPRRELVSRLKTLGLEPTEQFLDDARKINAVALQYVGAASPGLGKQESQPLPNTSPWINRTDEYIAAYERRADQKVAASQAKLDAMLRSKSWRVTRPLRKVVEKKNRLK